MFDVRLGTERGGSERLILEKGWREEPAIMASNCCRDAVQFNRKKTRFICSVFHNSSSEQLITHITTQINHILFPTVANTNNFTLEIVL